MSSVNVYINIDNAQDSYYQLDFVDLIFIEVQMGRTSWTLRTAVRNRLPSVCLFTSWW